MNLTPECINLQIEYDSADVDLFNKPSWFLEVSPFGKVSF